jgi:hypothetical protein
VDPALRLGQRRPLDEHPDGIQQQATTSTPDHITTLSIMARVITENRPLVGCVPCARIEERLQPQSLETYDQDWRQADASRERAWYAEYAKVGRSVAAAAAEEEGE